MRYVLFPGYVISQTDGQQHYINSDQLAHLYGVEGRNCKIVLPHTRDYYDKRPDDVILRPREDGNYTLGDNHE